MWFCFQQFKNAHSYFRLITIPALGFHKNSAELSKSIEIKRNVNTPKMNEQVDKYILKEWLNNYWIFIQLHQSIVSIQ